MFFTNSYAQLPEHFFSRTLPTPVKRPCCIALNFDLADILGVRELLEAEQAAQYFSGNAVFQEAMPLAMAYSGHQFGYFSAQLGDGRAVLLAEVSAPDGVGYDIQLKGSGPTPWSRGGDGRSALGPVLREYLVSEAMHALSVPTTRALVALSTGEEVFRERPIPGGILTRVAKGFVRVGSFQYFASRGDVDSLKLLADYVIQRHYPQAQHEPHPYVALLHEVMHAQAQLIAKWMSLGFIHGVMNTDNMAISGETIDYGPCAFMDEFSYSQTFSAIDRQGRYAYDNQAKMALWNLSRLAESLLPLFVENNRGGVAERQDVAVSLAQQVLAEFNNI